MDPPLAKQPEMVLMVPRRGGSAGVMSVRDLGWWVGWGICRDGSRVEGVCGRIERVAGSRGMVISTDETAKVTSTDQFFYFILECFAFFCSVAMVALVAAVFGHIGVRRCSYFAWWRD